MITCIDVKVGGHYTHDSSLLLSADTTFRYHEELKFDQNPTLFDIMLNWQTGDCMDDFSTGLLTHDYIYRS